MSAAKLKGLETKLQNLEAQLSTISTSITELNNNKTKLTKEYDIIKNQISILTTDFVVTEHALLRYLEYLYHIDITKIQQDILNIPNLDNMYETLGDGKYTNKDLGITVVIKNKRVVTITKKD